MRAMMTPLVWPLSMPAATSAAPAMTRIAHPAVLGMKVANDMAVTSVVVGVPL
jgi:hypothetical protein